MEININKKEKIQKSIYKTLSDMVKQLEIEYLTFLEGVDVSKIVADKYSKEIVEYLLYLCLEEKENEKSCKD